MPSAHAARLPLSMPDFSPRRRTRLTRLRALQHLPRRAQSSSGRRAPGKRVARALGALALLALAGLGARGIVGQKLNLAGEIERAARAQFIPQLEKQLGQRVEVGEFSTDLLGRVTVKDITIGRNSKLPTGALLRAKSLTLGLDIIGLALGRNPLPGAINRVTVNSPQVYLERAPNGKFNLESLLPKTKSGAKTTWSGTVEIVNGRVFYLDRALPSRSKRPLRLDITAINGTVIAAGDNPYRFDFKLGQTRLPDGSQIKNVSANGAFSPQPRRAWVDAKFPPVPVAVLADYAFPRGEIVASGGTVSGAAQIALDGATIVPRGQLQLSGISALSAQLREPLAGRANAGAPLQIQNLSGPLRFSNRAVESAGLSAQVLGASWTARGSASLPTGAAPVFDAAIATRAVPWARLKTWAKPGALPVDFTSGDLALSARLRGNPNDANVSGALEAPNVRVVSNPKSPTKFNAAMPRLNASFVAQITSKAPLTFAVRAQMPSVAGGARSSNFDASGGATDLEVTARGGGGPNSPLEVAARAHTWRASSAKYGASNGANLRVQASTPSLGKPNWRGAVTLPDASTKAINLDAFSPGARRLVRQSGTATAQIGFSNLGAELKNARARAAFTLSDVALAPDALPLALRGQIAARSLVLRALRGRVDLANGQISVSDARARSDFGDLKVATNGRTFALELPRVTLTAAQINPFLRARGIAVGGSWSGRVLVAGAPGGAVDARFQISSTRATARDLGSPAPRVVLESPVVRGRLSVAAGGEYRGEASLAAREISARGGKLGAFVVPGALNGARVVSARATANFAANAWAARVDAIRAALPLVGGQIATVGTPSVLAQNGAQSGAQLTRLAAKFAGGQLDGTAQIAGGKLSARVLARDVAAASLQKLAAPQSLKSARVSGSVDALIAVKGGGAPTLEATLARGSVFIVKQNARVPIDAARARLELDGQTARVREAVLWSEGARFRGTGRVDVSGRTVRGLPAASGSVQVDALRLASWASRLEALGVAGLSDKAYQQAAPDGLLSGDFRLTGGANPRVDGSFNLNAATAFGAEISSSAAQIAAAPAGQNGWRVRLSNWKGRIEGAPFAGDLALDTARNTWALSLQTNGIDAGRAARLRSLTAPLKNGVPAPLLPFEGQLSADVNVSGILKPQANAAQPFFVPRAGYAKVTAQGVAFQGQPLGTLNADVAIEDDLARIRTLELVPTPGRAGAPQTPRLSATGTVPLSPDAPGLNVNLGVGEAPLQFFIEATRDARQILEQSGVRLAALDSVVEYADALPAGTRGRVAMEASVGGTLRRPIVNVPALTLRDGRTPLPYGGFSPPATLDVGFSYDGRTATIERGEFRLQKTAAERANSESESAGDDTLLRVEPGASVAPDGEISLGADVFNANLSQLATWVPALRNAKNDPILRGELSEFSLRLSGQTRAPDVIGSIQAENLRFNEQTLDRLRLARFEIRDGRLQIAPGNFTVAKGAYQSSAASGFVGWDWARGGPQPNAPLDVSFPVETRDFAALAGLFVPALSGVGADELSGGVTVGGTLADPKLSGRVTLRNARLSLEGPSVALPVGLTKVSGTVRFTPDQRIEIDAADPLRGTLAGAQTVVAPSVKGKKAKKLSPLPPVNLAGDWKLTGAVGLDLSAQSLSNLERAVGRQRYDLAFALDGGAVSTPALAGVRDADVAARVQTGGDGAQRVRWMIAARGRRKSSQTKNGGQMVSIGQLRLAPDFASGPDALLRSVAETFDGTGFESFAVAKRVNLAALPDRRPQFGFDKLEWGYGGVGSGEVEGRLVLDNRAPIQQAPAAAERLKNASVPQLRQKLRENRGFSQTASGGGGFSSPRLQLEQFEAAPGGDGEALRLGGKIVLQNATLVGAPASGDGVVTRLALLPDAPRFDVRLVLGEGVQFVTSAFRTGLEGELVASGVPSNPELLGTVETRQGQVRFPNARARVGQGRVTVAINRDPATDLLRTRVDIDATATGRAGQYLITLELNGPLDLSGDGSNLRNLRVDVSSDPPLSQSEAFAQLLGTAPRGAADGTFTVAEANQAYAGAVLQVLAAPLFAGVEQSVAQALGLDSVSFEYNFDEPLAVQFSKALGDRVFLTYRRSFGNAQSLNGVVGSSRTPYQLSLEYRLKGNLRLGVRTDESQVYTLTLGQTYRF